MSCQVIQWICHHVINDSKVETGDEKKTKKINDNKKQQQNNADEILYIQYYSNMDNSFKEGF